jgi:cyclohexanone monooxygenase
MLYEARRLGLRALIVEAAPEVGGTWYWNRYPGARTDTEAWAYGFFFDRDLMQDYEWPERLPDWRQVVRYFEHVIDRFDMRKDIVLNQRVTGARYNIATNEWDVRTQDGTQFECRYLVTAIGVLNVGAEPPFSGVQQFRGETYITSKWPAKAVDFTGKRVAIVGSGSTAVQLLPVVAHSASQVSLYQRTANYVLPNRNHALTKEHLTEIKRDYDLLLGKCDEQVFGFPMNPAGRVFSDVTPTEARRVFERGWEAGGFRYLFETFDDLLVSQAANDAASEFVREKIRALVDDPKTAELLCPTHGIGIKRPPNGSGYYEAFNRSTVDLVDLRSEPIQAITETGIRTSTRDRPYDVIIYALGFDAATGSFASLDIRGKSGESLAQKWRDGPRTNLGICIDGFPNFFMISGPQSPFANIPVVVEHAVQWIGGAIERSEKGTVAKVEATAEAVQAWGATLETIFNATLLPQAIAAGSWAVGANIPGKKPSVLFYFGGANNYFKEISAVRSDNYRGFLFSE